MYCILQTVRDLLYLDGQGRGWEDHPHYLILVAAGHHNCEMRAYTEMGAWRTPAVHHSPHPQDITCLPACNKCKSSKTKMESCSNLWMWQESTRADQVLQKVC